MRKLSLLLFLLLWGCGNPVQPSYVVYISRDVGVTELVVEKGIELANEFNMHYVSADESLYQNDFELIFESTESGWLYRSLGFGEPKGAAILIAVKPKNIYITLSHVHGANSLTELKYRWESYLSLNQIEFDIDAREKTR